jgi:tight adherence protein B
MGGLVGLVFGCGLVLIWRSGARRPPRIRRRRNPFLRLREVLWRAGLPGVGPVHVVGAQVACSLVAFVSVLAVTSAISVAICFAMFAFFVPIMLLRRMTIRRCAALREQWPEAIDNLASAVRAGMSLPEALGALAEHGPADLREPFARFGSNYRTNGRFAECLNALRDDLADPVGDRVCETVRVAREVGGSDVGSVLRALAELLRSDARTRAELETRQGWVVNAARLAVAAPWIVLLLLGSQSATLRAFDSPGGNLLLGIGAVVCLLAYRVMLYIGRLPREIRMLG